MAISWRGAVLGAQIILLYKGRVAKIVRSNGAS